MNAAVSIPALTLPVFLNLIGQSLEDGAYRAEGFLSLKEIDTSCVENLEKIFANFDLEAKFNDLESNALYGGQENDIGYGDSCEIKKEKLQFDIEDFSSTFQVFCNLSIYQTNVRFTDPLGRLTHVR